MPFARAKSLQQLYDAVSGYDIVLVPDLPLATALNRRPNRPHAGTFAMTPRQFVGTRRAVDENRQVFLTIIERSDHSWKQTAYAISNALQCWQHTGEVDAILEYDSFADSVTQTVVEELSELDTTSKQLSDYTIPAGKSVAVIGDDQLTPLERSILPKDYDTFALFSTDSFDLPPFHIFESAAEIVDSLLDTITVENAENVGIVLDSGSQYSSLVESALEAADIPFYGGPGFIDIPAHRAYLNLLRAGFRGPATTIGDIKPLLTHLDIEIPHEDTEKHLQTVDHPQLAWLQSLCTDIENTTFREVLAAFSTRTHHSLPRLRKELSRLGIATAQITEARVDDLAFYLQTYDVPVDRDGQGVVLADATSSGYVDRPVVFYLGLDNGWTHSVPQRPWIEADTQMTRYLSQFQLLLQSGSEQYYLVEDTAGGQPVTPCLYFNELLERDFDRFSDLPSRGYSRMLETEATGFEKETYDIEAGASSTISQSSLNSFVNSPRDWFFSQLIDSPQKDYFREGNLLHDFAEFYVANPEFVDEAILEEVVDVILAEVEPFYAATDRPLRKRTYEIGIETIVEFLDANPPTDGGFLTPASGYGQNFFAEHFDRDIDTPVTERWFEDDSRGIKGKIDLVHAPTTLLDYKKSSKKRETQVVKRSAIDPPADTPNFQAILYLTHYRTVQPNEKLEFTFFHFLETLDDVIAGDANLDDTLTTVTYYPYTFDEFVDSRDAYETLLDGYNDCVATFEDLGFDAYTEIMSQLSFPETTDKAELLASPFAEEFETEVVAATGDGVDAEKGVEQAIRALNGVRRRAFFREDLDAFEGFVDEQLAELNHYRAGNARTPIEGPAGEPNYRRVNHRDLLLEGQSNE